MTDSTSFAPGAQRAATQFVTIRPRASRVDHDWRLEALIAHLPKAVQPVLRWLRLPSSRWLRIPAGMLLIVGGLLSFLPLLGIWMLPLGIALLAEDVPLFRRITDRGLDWVERRRPHWFKHPAP